MKSDTPLHALVRPGMVMAAGFLLGAPGVLSIVPVQQPRGHTYLPDSFQPNFGH